MVLILIALVVSCAGLAVVRVTSRRSAGAGRVTTISLLAAFFFVLFGSLALVLQSLLTALFAAICGVLGWGSKAIMRGAVAAMAVAYLWALLIFVPELLERKSLRQQFPVESLKTRLAYETNKPVVVTESTAELPVLSTPVEANLRRTEKRTDYSYRRELLRRLHDQNVDEFVAAQGFGPVRMAGVGGMRQIPLPEAMPISLPRKPDYSPDVVAPPPLAKSGPPRMTYETLLALNEAGRGDFLDADRMGYVQDSDHVTGFLPHQFTKMPQLNDDGGTKHEWRIVRLELLSLLKHETPVAYLSDHLPRMDELRDAATRPLDSFEQHALAQLRTDEDLVVEESSERIQMLGSLRAGKDCMACHSVRRGELLGAFSYELVPIQQTAPPNIKTERPADEQAFWTIRTARDRS